MALFIEGPVAGEAEASAFVGCGHETEQELTARGVKRGKLGRGWNALRPLSRRSFHPSRRTGRARSRASGSPRDHVGTEPTMQLALMVKYPLPRLREARRRCVAI